MSGSRACARPKINWMNNVMSWTGLTIEGAVREEKVGERLSVMRPAVVLKTGQATVWQCCTVHVVCCQCKFVISLSIWMPLITLYIW